MCIQHKNLNPSPTSLSFLYIYKYMKEDGDMKSGFYCMVAKVLIWYWCYQKTLKATSYFFWQMTCLKKTNHKAKFQYSVIEIKEYYHFKFRVCVYQQLWFKRSATRKYWRSKSFKAIRSYYKDSQNDFLLIFSSCILMRDWLFPCAHFIGFIREMYVDILV